MKELYDQLNKVVKKRGNNTQYIELSNKSNFINLSLKEKLDFVNLILSGRIQERDKEKLKKLAYRALTKSILDYNLEYLDAPLEFIYDESHKHQIEKLKDSLEFLKRYKDFKFTAVSQASAFKGFVEEIAILSKRIGKAILEINQGPTHVLCEIDFAFNRARRYLKMNPADKSWINFNKQFVGGLFNISIWLSKQAVNFIRKPIAFCINSLKCISNLAILKPKDAYNNFKDALFDLQETAVAWGTAIVITVFAPFVPVAPAVATALTVVGVHSAATILIASAKALSIHKPLGIAIEAVDIASKTGHFGAEYLTKSSVQINSHEDKASQVLYNLMQNYENANKSDLENYHIKQQSLTALKNLTEYIKNEKLKKTGVLGNIAAEFIDASSNLSSKFPERNNSSYRK